MENCRSVDNAVGTIKNSNGYYAKDIEIQGEDLAENLPLVTSTENGNGKNVGDSVGIEKKIEMEAGKMGNDLEAKAHTNIHFQRAGVDHSHPFHVDTDPRFWIPPEPEDAVDEIECSVALNDDDDVCSDGVKWVSSVNSISEEIGSNLKVKEAHSEEIVEIVRKHFRATIAELLDFEKIEKNWVDTVSSLSWEAASLIKPSADEDVCMDPTRYLKVKCVASGLPSESHVINGLVFKKNTAHKHMLTTYKNPRLLLLRGVLGERDGLSSFKAMGQILLMGAPSNELKKVKALFQQTVYIAYHFILESSLLLDQRATITCRSYSSELDRESTAIPSNLDVDISSRGSANGEEAPSAENDILIEGGSEEMPLEVFGHMPPPLFYSEQLISAMTASFEKVVTSRLFSSYLGYIGSGMHHSRHKIGFLSPQIANGKDESSNMEEKKRSSEDREDTEDVKIVGTDDEESGENFGSSEKIVTSDFYEEPSNNEGVFDLGKPDTLEDEENRHILGPKSILVLHSSRCKWKDTVCKSNTLSRMKFYGYFDVSLGKILSGLMLNQKYNCLTCMEPPESHEYSYTHQNGRIIIRVKSLPVGRRLPGESEGKIWMWFICLKCKDNDGTFTPTRRTVMSSTTHALSFGKYLELSFSMNLDFNRSLSCGHCLHKDCLQFFGLGSKIVMFHYSDVEIYAACSPPLFLEFTSACDQKWLSKEAQDVLAKGQLLFTEVMNLLHKIGSGQSSFLKQPLFLGGSVMHLDDIEKMLKQEKSEFESSLERILSRNGQLGHVVQQVLSLNRLNHELLLQLYVWDRRIQYLLSIDKADIRREEIKQKGNDSSFRGGEGHNPDFHDDVLEGSSGFSPIAVESYSVSDDDSCNINCLETQMACAIDENFDRKIEISESMKERSSDEKPNDMSLVGHTPHSRSLRSNDGGWGDKNLQDQHFVISSTVGGSLRSSSSDVINIEGVEKKLELSDKVIPKSLSDSSLLLKVAAQEGWVWRSFSETREAYRKDLKSGYSQKFEIINNYTPAHLSMVNQYISQERSQLHFPIGSEDDYVSVYEDEFTSIIACALALSFDNVRSSDKMNALETGNDDGESGFTYEAPSLSSQINGKSASSLMDLETNYLEKDRTSGGSFTFGANEISKDNLLHPEISLGVEVSPGKTKYSVVCIHAKLFYDLRKKCCPSELDYISSLSRCKHWNAQGGKSKSFFAKTLDDRFIVKQIKKTEFDSFVKFAPDYYNHITDSLSKGSQTCLAKILGVYQVTIRQNKNGKELRISLIVMENLVFGRHISRLYDLKGALHLRLTADSDLAGKVLLDQNFVNDMWHSPVYISGTTKQKLLRAVWNDTSFLTGKNVMDYSLLVGVDEQRQELVCGIIDYLREYTWDKHLETWVKASLVVPKNSQPTVISPKEYKKRFRKFMSHFLTIPDWSNEQKVAYTNCKLDCSSVNHDSEKIEETG